MSLFLLYLYKDLPSITERCFITFPTEILAYKAGSYFDCLPQFLIGLSTWFHFSAPNVNNAAQMDVVICLPRLLKCYLFLLPEVINKDGESQFKSNPCIMALETLLHPQTDLTCHYLTSPFVFFHSAPQISFTIYAPGRRDRAQFCDLK